MFGSDYRPCTPVPASTLGGTAELVRDQMPCKSHP